MPVKTIAIGCTEIIHLDVRDKLTGIPLPDADVKIKFYELNSDTPIPNSTFEFEKVPGIPGLWRTIIPASFTSQLKKNRIYKLRVEIIGSRGNFVGEEHVMAVIAPIS
ncbi:MAG: hypothetical protein QXQ37_04105 [Nitrososphaerota archaeon]